jgi:hypothetical protein
MFKEKDRADRIGPIFIDFRALCFPSPNTLVGTPSTVLYSNGQTQNDVRICLDHFRSSMLASMPF